MRFHNYKNKYTNNNIIHSFENILAMPVTETFGRSAELNSQYNQIGFPRNAELNASPNAVFVNAYTKDDGTQVCAHWRSKPEGGIIANQIQNGISIPKYAGGIFGEGVGENNSAEVNIENLIAPLLLPMILSQIPMAQNIQPQQNVPTGFASDIDTNQLNNNILFDIYNNKNSQYVGNETDTPVYHEGGLIKGGISNDYPIDNDNILSQSGGYIKPAKTTRSFGELDKAAIDFNNKQNKDRPDAKQLLEIGIYGVDSYDNNSQFKHIPDKSAVVFNSLYDLEGNKTIPSDMKGIEFTKKSDFSKRISEDKDFQQTVRSAIDRNNGIVPNKIELDFNKDSNLNYSIGHGTLLNIRITKDGYVEGYVFDKYDYNKWKLDKIIKDPITSLYNNGAWTLHEWNKLEYYYYFVPVRFKY